MSSLDPDVVRIGRGVWKRATTARVERIRARNKLQEANNQIRLPKRLPGYSWPVLPVSVATGGPIGIIGGAIGGAIWGGLITITYTATRLYDAIQSARESDDEENAELSEEEDDNPMPEFSEGALEKTVPSLKTQDISKDGGTIQDAGTSVNFPTGSLKEGGRVKQYSMFAEDMLNEGYFPATRLVHVETSVPISGLIDISFESAVIPTDEEDDVDVYILRLSENGSEWIQERAFKLREGGLGFSTLTPHSTVAAIKIRDLIKVKFRIKALLYSNQTNSFRFYFLHSLEVMEMYIDQKAKALGYSEVLEFTPFPLKCDDKVEALIKVQHNSSYEFEQEKISFHTDNEIRKAKEYKSFDTAMVALHNSIYVICFQSCVKVNGRNTDLRSYNYEWKHPADEEQNKGNTTQNMSLIRGSHNKMKITFNNSDVNIGGEHSGKIRRQRVWEMRRF